MRLRDSEMIPEHPHVMLYWEVVQSTTTLKIQLLTSKYSQKLFRHLLTFWVFFHVSGRLWLDLVYWGLLGASGILLFRSYLDQESPLMLHVIQTLPFQSLLISVWSETIKNHHVILQKPEDQGCNIYDMATTKRLVSYIVLHVVLIATLECLPECGDHA